jgi:hypothetical protein
MLSDLSVFHVSNEFILAFPAFFFFKKDNKAHSESSAKQASIVINVLQLGSWNNIEEHLIRIYLVFPILTCT